MRSSVPLLSARVLSWLYAVTSTGPRAMASRTSLRKRADRVNSTAAGLVKVKVAIAAESEARTTMPRSKLRRRSFDRGIVGIDRGDQLVHLRLLLIDHLLRLKVFVHQGARTGKVLLRRIKLRFVLHPLGLGLIERRKVEAGINAGQDIALLDLLAFDEQNGFKLAVDLRPDADGEGGLHRAEAGKINRQIALCGDRSGYRNSGRCRGTSRPNRLRALMQVPCSCAANRDHQRAKQKYASTATHVHLLERPPRLRRRSLQSYFWSLSQI